MSETLADGYTQHSLVQTASWEDVILDPAMKKTLINDVHGFFDSRSLYQEYSVPWKRGIIMCVYRWM